MNAPILGSLLTDESWLGGRVDATARRLGCPERRTNATLWWYSASSVLLGPAVRDLVLTGTAESIWPSSIRFTLRPGGYLERVFPGPALDPGPAVLGRHLDDVLGAIIEPLSRTGTVSERSLWAVAVDSLAGAVLNASTVLPGGHARAPELALAIAAAGARLRPLPRFVDVQAAARPDSPSRGAPKTSRYVKRGSCCLLWRVPDGKCISCPNQTPAERLDRLARHTGQ